MEFPQAVRTAFPRQADAPMRARILTLARDGGDIRPAAREFALTDMQRITFGLLCQWVDKARTATFFA